jgi:hypothetical protein
MAIGQRFAAPTSSPAPKRHKSLDGPRQALPGGKFLPPTSQEKSIFSKCLPWHALCVQEIDMRAQLERS